MASRQPDERPGRRTDDASALVFLPCPACRHGVQLSEDNRANGDDEYECPNCGARLVVSDA
jgi:predicted RNA-binding Zn-ribbon protein involved in translation (DUF1610 family)